MAYVVVAEDDADIRAVMVRVLQRGGHTVKAVADGAQALSLILELPPDVVVADIDMPVMSGIELCRAIRTGPATRAVPVVFVSGGLMPGDERPARAQATATLPKPFQNRQLLACVTRAAQTGHDSHQPPWDCR